MGEKMRELTAANTYAMAMSARSLKQQYILRRFKGCTVRCKCHEKSLWSMQVLENFKWKSKGFCFSIQSVHDVCEEAREDVS